MKRAERRGRRLRSLGVAALVAAIPALAVALGVGGLAYRQLARRVDEKFAGRRWDFPSRIYSDEFLLYPGLDVERARIARRLERLAYREVAASDPERGEFRREDGEWEIGLRRAPGDFPTGLRVRLDLEGTRIRRIVDLDTGDELQTAALEPEELTGIYEGEWEDRRAVRVVDVAPILVRAILVTEDRRFFEHRGVDLHGILRAAWANFRSGRIRQGGSTLTQQLMKNFFLTTDRTLSRKLREVAMAVVAETRYSKMEILENYLNEIYLGQQGARGIFGVAEASRFYFGKSPRDLDVAEAALLAGLIRAPGAYSPLRSPEKARQRRDLVLRLLRDAGEIDEATYAAVVTEPIRVVRHRDRRDRAPFFVEDVKQELAKRFPADVLTAEGLQVFTTLDPILQEEADRAVREGLRRLEETHPELRERGDRLEAALVAIAPGTGEIKALVGGRSYAESQFNRATQARRQPGSAFKPIVYLAGLVATEPERHLTPTTLLRDQPFTWAYQGGRSWSPRNYGGEYHGEVTVRVALESSLNAAAARVAQVVGLPPIVRLARAMGIRSPLPQVPSIVLGSAEVTPLEMTAAYAVLASGGVRIDPFAIERVESREGDVIVGERPAMRPVVSPAAAYVMTHLLEGVLDRGTGRSARAAGFTRPAAGKTGTTNDYRDAWFVGYTPDLVAGVWVGFDHGSRLGLSGARAALPIWVSFMKRATGWQEPRPFPVPPGVTMVAVDHRSGEVASVAAARTGRPADPIEEAFLTGDEPVWSSPLDVAVADSRSEAPMAGASAVAP